MVPINTVTKKADPDVFLEYIIVTEGFLLIFQKWGIRAVEVNST